MDVFKLAERSMRMTDDVWLRHANPWSVWTRFSCLPLIVLAIWSRVWLGWWALVPLTAALIWTWWNPRAFPPAKRTDTWTAKGTFGERILLNRKTLPIPAHHLRAGLVLSVMSATGLVPLVWGLWVLNVEMTLLGLMMTILPKVWFVDRMVWLYEDMKNAYPEFSAKQR